ncbi:MAG: AAA family ATPase, partial [Elainellaceae cyanobacterium]
ELLLSEASAPELETLLQETRGASAPIQPAATLPVQFSAPSRNVNQSGLAANAGNAPQMSSAAKAEPPVSPPTTAPEAASKAVQSATWEDLILPSALIAELKHLSDRLRVQSIVDDQWEFKQQNFGAIQPGRVALLVGDAGTGKTMAARAVASAANGPLVIHDLALLSPSRWSAVIETLMTSCPPVLLIKSAQRWFGPQSKLAGLEELIAQRQQRPTLTLLSTHQLEVVGLRWRRRLDRTLRFPQPDEGDRFQLWKQAFPKTVALGRLRWPCLAALPLNGGEIAALAREAAILAAAEPSERIMQRHMTAALNRQGYRLPKQEK